MNVLGDLCASNILIIVKIVSAVSLSFVVSITFCLDKEITNNNNNTSTQKYEV